MLPNKRLVDEPFFDDDMRHGIRDGEVCVRFENRHNIRRLIGAAVQKGLQAHDLHLGVPAFSLHHPRVKDRLRLSEVRAPDNKRIGRLNVVVTPHRLVHAERRVETRDSRGHTEARVPLNIVGADPRLHQFIDGVAFEDRGLT